MAHPWHISLCLLSCRCKSGKELSYLGTQLNQTNSTNSETHARILSGNRCYYSCGKLMKSRALSRDLELKIYKRLIRPVLTYGCEAWTLTTRDEQHLKIIERKILRKFLVQNKTRIDPGESE